MSQYVFLSLLSKLHARVKRVVSFLSIYHLSGEVDALINAIVADHHWHNHQISATLLETHERLDEPTYRHVSLLASAELTRTESLIVLENRSDLVVTDDLFKHGTVDIVALK